MQKSNSISDFKEYLESTTTKISKLNPDFIDDSPLLSGSSKLGEFFTLKPNEPELTKDEPKIQKQQKSSDASLETVTIKDGFEIFDIILPDIEPIDTVSLKTPGYLYLPEHGVERELDQLLYLSNEKEIIDKIGDQIMEQADSEFLAWSIDDILDDLVDFGIPTTEEFQNIMSIEEAASKAEDIQKKILANQKADKKDAKTEPELIPKSDVWVPDSSIVHNENTFQINWNRIKNSMSKLKFSDQLKETVASVTANIKDTDVMENLGRSWRDMADLIFERERELQNLHDFTILDSDAERYWFSFHEYNPLSNSDTRVKMEKNMQKLSKRILPLIAEIEVIYDIKISFQNRVYKEKMKKDVTEMYFYLRHNTTD